MRAIRLFVLGFLTVACASAKVSENHLVSIPQEASFRLASVSTDTDGEVEDESSWIAAIRRGFEEEAAELGIAGGGTPVDIRITRCEPGSKALRYWIGFGAGAGHLAASVSLSGHGEMDVTGSVSMGFFGGSFEAVCEKAGRAVARALHEARGD